MRRLLSAACILVGLTTSGFAESYKNIFEANKQATTVSNGDLINTHNGNQVWKFDNGTYRLAGIRIGSGSLSFDEETPITWLPEFVGQIIKHESRGMFTVNGEDYINNNGVGERSESFSSDGPLGKYATQDVQDAWADGWTGEGINIGVIDSFYKKRNWKFADSNQTFYYSHGDRVAHTAGGEWDGTHGIAAKATVEKLNIFQVNFMKNLDVSNHDILNMSFSMGPGNSDYYKNIFNNKVDGEKGTLITQTAGNAYGKTVEDHGDALVKGLMESKYADSTLIVGAVYRNAPNQIAMYSNVPGNKYKDNFVVDVGQGSFGLDVWANGNYRGRWFASGTSFAAPKVAGKAAIIMQKFNTNAADTATIIKKTADDLGAPGVDPVFGWGRVNLANALSPMGHMQ